MKAHALYSLIQFQPCASRAERVNVGVVLASQELDFLKCQTTDDFTRCHVLDSRENIEATLNLELRAIRQRINNRLEVLPTRESLVSFARTRGNRIKLTEPRPMRLAKEPSRELEELFERLVK